MSLYILMKCNQYNLDTGLYNIKNIKQKRTGVHDLEP